MTAGSSSCSEGVEGGSESTSCADLKGDPPLERRVLSDESVDVVWSRIHSIPSHVCSVASGAKETRLLASVFRRAACRAFFSKSSFGIIELVEGTYVDLRLFFASSLSCFGASWSSSPPGPMLLLRPFLVDFRGDGDDVLCWCGSLEVEGATFSLSSATAIVSVQLATEDTNALR